MFEEAARVRKDQVVLSSQGVKYTWRGLADESARLAGWLREKGVQRGERVACHTDDSVMLFSLMIAAWRLGLVFAPINTSMSPRQKSSILHTLRPVALLTDDNHDMEFAGATAVLDVRAATANLDENVLADLSGEDVALILFTSGSSGTPKGVVTTHAALLSNVELTAAALGIAENDRILINTPAYFTSAICHFLTMIVRGAALHSHDGFLFASTFVELINEHGCTGFGGSPAHLNRIFPPMDDDSPKPSTLRFVMNSGDHLPRYLIKKALGVYPDLEIYCVYGLTEVAGRLFILDPKHLPEKAGSVGKPFTGMTVRLLDEDGQPCPPGELGEVYVDGPMLTSSYFENEAESAQLRTPSGFRSGDVGYFDDDGFLFLTGREDDVFKSGGEKVSALLIQEVLLSLEELADCAVTSDDDPVMMKVPVAYYVLRDGHSFDRDSVLERARGELPANHLPRKFVQLDEIPRTTSGKVQREQLRNL